jgi:hypothetical protein
MAKAMEAVGMPFSKPHLKISTHRFQNAEQPNGTRKPLATGSLVVLVHAAPNTRK